MAKFHYFESLEQLSELCEQVVRLGCMPSTREAPARLSEARRASDGIVCSLEDALFSDFLPPLERDSIAACAHALSRVIDQASELIARGEELSPTLKDNREAALCISLSEELSRSVAMLRRIAKPDQSPDIQGFRSLLGEGRAAHAETLSGLHRGALPRSALATSILLSRLRTELSHAFDELVEVMLNNI